MDPQSFLEYLRQSRLLTDQQMQSVADDLDAGLTPPEIVERLCNDGVLTQFQVQKIATGQPQGLVLGQYRIIDRLGSGGFGQVFKAVHALMDRVVAIKVMSPEFAEIPKARNLFRREVLALTSLSHPNIVVAHDADEIDGQLFLVMEYVDGPSLESLVKIEGPQPVGVACEMMRQACAALQYAHERGMVHRDVKPANILVSRLPGGAPLVKVVDFGLARLHATAKAGTLLSQNEKSFLGTPDYVSPEQARNAHDVDIRSDLYSLGCTFYLALTGKKPFQGETVVEVICQHLDTEPLPLEKLRLDVPPGVANIVKKLMAKDPAKRFQTPGELAAELAYWRGHCAKEIARSKKVAKVASKGTRVIPQISSAEAAPPARQTQPAPASGDPALQATQFLPSVALAGSPTAAQIPPSPPVKSAAVHESAAVLTPPAPVAMPRAEAQHAEILPIPAPTPVKAPVQSAPADLKQAFEHWLTIIERFADGDQTYEDLHDYRAAHVELMRSCREQPQGTQERNARLNRLHEVARPWMAPEALTAADRPTLHCLVREVRQLQGELGLRSTSTWAGIFTFLAFILVVVGAAWGYTEIHTSVTRAHLTPSSMWSIIEAHPVASLVVVIPGSILIAVLGVTRPWRT